MLCLRRCAGSVVGLGRLCPPAGVVRLGSHLAQSNAIRRISTWYQSTSQSRSIHSANQGKPLLIHSRSGRPILTCPFHAYQRTTIQPYHTQPSLNSSTNQSHSTSRGPRPSGSGVKFGAYSSTGDRLALIGAVIVLVSIAGYINETYLMPLEPGGTTFDRAHAFLLELRRQDQQRPNYSPALEDRVMGPDTVNTHFTEDEYYALPSLSELALLWSISPGLAWQELCTRFKLIGERGRLFDAYGQAQAAAAAAIEQGGVAPKKAGKLLKLARKDIHHGGVFLLSARVLNELAVSLRLQGQVDESKRIARLASLRFGEASNLIYSGGEIFYQVLDGVFIHEWLEVESGLLETRIRRQHWDDLDSWLGEVQTELKQIEQPWNETELLYYELKQYQLLEIQAELLQLRHQYAEAIPAWKALLKHSKRPFPYATVGTRDLPIVEFTNQLCHCYLQVNDVKRAWATYELGLKLEEMGQIGLNYQWRDIVQTLEWRQTQADKMIQARADAEILKQRILAKNNGAIPEKMKKKKKSKPKKIIPPTESEESNPMRTQASSW